MTTKSGHLLDGDLERCDFGVPGGEDMMVCKSLFEGTLSKFYNNDDQFCVCVFLCHFPASTNWVVEIQHQPS